MVNHHFGDSRMFRSHFVGFSKNFALIQQSTASHTINLKRKKLPKIILNQLGFLFIRAPQEVREP